jgi:thiamine biosynthesis protein ThiS
VYATVNGERRELRSGATVAELLRNLKVEGPGIAVAVNERVVRSSRFDEHRLSEGDVVEIIRAVAGG